MLQGSQEEKRERKDQRKIFEEIIVENFPNMGKELAIQVQEAQSPIQNKLKEKTPRHMVSKLAKIKDKEKLLKEARVTRKEH